MFHDTSSVSKIRNDAIPIAQTMPGVKSDYSNTFSPCPGGLCCTIRIIGTDFADYLIALLVA